MRLVRELGTLKHRGPYAGIAATCANGTCIEVKLYGPMGGEWSVTLRGGDCLVRNRKFNCCRELEYFLFAVVPGLMSLEQPNIERNEVMSAREKTEVSMTWLEILRTIRNKSEQNAAMIIGSISDMEPPGLKTNTETMIGYDGHLFLLHPPEYDAEFASELQGTVFTHAGTSVKVDIGTAGSVTIACSLSLNTSSGRENWRVDLTGGDFRIRTRSFNDTDAMTIFVRQAVGRLVGRRLSVVR